MRWTIVLAFTDLCRNRSVYAFCSVYKPTCNHLKGRGGGLLNGPCYISATRTYLICCSSASCATSGFCLLCGIIVFQALLSSVVTHTKPIVYPLPRLDLFYNWFHLAARLHCSHDSHDSGRHYDYEAPSGRRRWYWGRKRQSTWCF